MHVRCPHCRNPIELVDGGALEEVNWPSCGSSFSLVGTDSTETYRPETVETLDHFMLEERIGVRAMGAVLKAKDAELDRTVAIKFPRKGQLGAAETKKFLRDSRTVAQLKFLRNGFANVLDQCESDGEQASQPGATQ